MRMKQYAYFFTRQDMSPEQQIVQTAHAALKLGVNSATTPPALDADVPYVSNINPDETYFTVVGVRDLSALYAVQSILDKFGYRYEMFVEPDMNDEPTSIAVYPISEFVRGPLKAFNLLKVRH